MSANDLVRLYRAIRRNHDFDFHVSANVHSPRQFWILWRYLIHDFSLDLALLLLGKALRAPHKGAGNGACHENQSDVSTHLKFTSLVFQCINLSKHPQVTLVRSAQPDMGLG